MNFKLIPALGLIAIIIACVLIFRADSAEPESPDEGVHYHAGFQVYVDNELQDFSDLKYMNTEPCGSHEETHATAEDEQQEKAHLHDNIGDVVHSHREGAIWRDLFTNMPYNIEEEDLEMYVNGERVEDERPLDRPIVPYESVVFFVGENDDIQEKLQSAVGRTHIETTEQRSENCGV